MWRSVEANLSSVLLGWHDAAGHSTRECLPQDKWMLSSGIFSSLGHCETCEIPFLRVGYKVSVIWHWHWMNCPDFFPYGWIICAKQDAHRTLIGNCTLCTCTGSRRVSGRMEIFTAPSSGSMRTDLCLTSSPVWTTSPSTPPSLNHTAWTVWRRWGLLGQFLFLFLI